ncbi:MAG: alpha/beta fold hydrolase [Firmicutes bacterium]|nr:alpha/beta fold hydrolase [Bacillota bacterium]
MAKYVHVNGVRLMVEDLGEGPAILTLHGGPGMGSRHGDVATFGVLAQEGYRVVSYDQRGNGESEGGEPYSHEQFVADAEALRRQLNLGRIVVAGGSYGGHLALEYALRHQDQLAGLILRDTSASNQYQAGSKALALARQLPGVNEEMLDRLFGGRVASDEEFRDMYRAILPLYWVEATPDQLEDHLSRIRFRHETHNYAFARNQPVFNLVPRLSEIQVPTLVLVGRHDWITPVAASEEIAAHIPHSRLVIFERSGHSPQIEERDAFLAEVRQFLREVFSPRV